MKNKTIVFSTILCIISIGNYLIFVSKGQTRAVEFISILAIGILIGVFVTKLIDLLQTRN